MCGIFGVINTKEKIDEGRILAARDTLAHRGPDDSGIYISSFHPELSVTLSSVSSRAESRDEGPPFVALAHRRLSIIDLSPAAHQPMTTTDGRYTIVYNGEIYNFRELSPRLTSHVSRLTSQSDTEVILTLYAQYGKECLNLLRGMFSFAIWDEKEKTLFAARDRFGIKPFYYYKSDTEFIFSSELKAIKHYKKNLTLSIKAVDAFLRTGSVPAPLTIYNEVSSLLPGHLLEIDCHPERSRRVSIFNYWNFSDLFISHPEPVSGSALSLRGTKRRGNLKYDDNAKQKIRTALLDSVRAHMVADVDVGAFLSGGIDSTAIVSLMRQVGQEKIKTVSVVFPNNKLDESKYARLAAKTYNTEHIEIPFYEKDLIDDFENIMASMDQPTIDGINTYFVSKAAKQAGLKVVLSGLGGDELFGGYPTFINIPKYQRIKNLPFAKTFMKAAAPLLKNRLPAKAIEYFLHPDSENAEYKLVRGLFTNEELQTLGWQAESLQSSVFSPPSSVGSPKTTNDPMTINDLSSAPDAMLSALSSSATNDPMTTNDTVSPQSATPYALSDLQYVSMMESCFYMRNQLLRDSDVFSMAHSLELRVPFVDHILYKSVLPYLDSAFDKNYPKKMLVNAVGDLPLELINRPKMGFTFPFEDWIMNGQLKDLMTDSIKNLNSDLNTCPPWRIEHSSLNIDKLHWSRLWALFILSRIEN